MSYRSPWRKLGARAAVVTSVAGTTVVLMSVLFLFVDNTTGRILGVSIGLVLLVVAVYYTANPFVRNERIYLALRAEVDVLLDTTRELHYAAIRGDFDAFDSIKERVPGQVEALVAAAKKSGPKDGQQDETSEP
jgi:hypothetical protein